MEKKMFDEAAAAQYHQFLEGLQGPGSFSSAELLAAHPFATTVHRRAASRDMLGTAYGGREYTRTRNNTQIHISMEFTDGHQQGISVSAFCCYKPQIRSGLYPITNDLLRLGFTLFEEENLVQIQGEEYPVVKCFNRPIEAVEGVTVGEALALRGKEDRLLIDDHFTAHFNNPQHCNLVLRNAEQQNNGNFAFINDNRQVQFSEVMFARAPWTECGLSFVKIPSALMSVVLAGKKIEDVLDSKGGQTKRIVKLLGTAFNASGEHAAGAVNALIERCVAVKDVATLPLDIRQAISDVLEEHCEELFGMDPTCYFEELQPVLLAQGGGGVGDIADDMADALSFLSLSKAESECIYMDICPHEHITAKLILTAFHKQFAQPALVKIINPVILRCAVDVAEITLPVGSETRHFRRVDANAVDFLVNNADGMDLPLRTTASVVVHLQEAATDEHAQVPDFASDTQDLDILEIGVSVNCCALTKRGLRCKNRTRHHSGRCHFHR
jgi:hypothetical protein